jgi:hypothetical protein
MGLLVAEKASKSSNPQFCYQLVHAALKCLFTFFLSPFQKIPLIKSLENLLLFIYLVRKSEVLLKQGA